MAAEEQFAGKTHAKIYSSYRKDTPRCLIEKIILHLKEKYDGPLDFAVDVGCGSGQSTTAIASFFKKVRGMDVSEAQIEEAKASRNLPNVTYEVSPAEILPFDDGSVQIVTAGAALHWFKLDEFFPEVLRILCKNGILAVYCYFSMKPHLKDPQAEKEVEELYQELYTITAEYHAPQAKIAFDLYRTVDFPFQEVLRFHDVRDFFEGKIEDVVGYISTFSGFQNLMKKDEGKATEFLSKFERRLRDVVTKCKMNVNETMELYRSFVLIICRKS